MFFAGDCDEEGWLMAMNSAGERGYVPQNYLEVEGLDPNASIDQVVAEQQVRSLAQLFKLLALQGPCVS